MDENDVLGTVGWYNPKRKPGRPGKLSSGDIQEAEQAIQNGATQEEVATTLGVHTSTLGRSLAQAKKDQQVSTSPVQAVEPSQPLPILREEDDPVFAQLAEAQQSERAATAELLRAQEGVADVKLSILRKGIFYIRQAGIDFEEIRSLIQEALMWLLEMEDLSREDGEDQELFRELAAMKEAALLLHGMGLPLIPYEEALAAHQQRESGN